MTSDNDTATRRHALVDLLTTGGWLRSPHWQRAFLEVPRHEFVPRFTITDRDGRSHNYDVNDSARGKRAAALDRAYANETLVTRFDTEGVPTSSSTEPSLMAMMLEALDARRGHRVLEVGTGTGYNTALLCAALGSRNVTSIDIEPELTTAATDALRTTGFHPAVVCGDGALGVPDNAPFDRVIATCGVDRIPEAWRTQLAPHGAILANVSRGIVLLRGDGTGALSGRFLGQAGFMPLRNGHTPRSIAARQVIKATVGDSDDTERVQLPSALDFRMMSFLASLVAEHSEVVGVHDEDGRLASYRWLHPTSAAWARVDVGDTGAVVHQSGDRRLWDELAPHLRRWAAAGCPDIDHVNLTVDQAGVHHIDVSYP